MQLLLLLSAILSALTGVVTGARAEAPPQVASMQIAAAIEAVAPAAAARAVRPVQPQAMLAAVAVAPLAPATIRFAAPLPYESRRRE